jgi:signal recognition particle subunit SRP54
MRAVTGRPIKLIGTGEKMDALEDFHPGRIADRILGMGDIVSLVERAAENIDAEKAKAAAAKMKKGEFDLEDLSEQLRQMQKIGGMSGILGMMPGMAKMKNQLSAAGLDDKVVPRQLAIISSMTKAERQKPALMKWQPPQAHRGRFRYRRGRRQQASQDAPADVGHDEERSASRRAASARCSEAAARSRIPPCWTRSARAASAGFPAGGMPGLGGGMPGGMLPKLPSLGGRGSLACPGWGRRSDALARN